MTDERQYYKTAIEALLYHKKRFAVDANIAIQWPNSAPPNCKKALESYRQITGAIKYFKGKLK
jgi:hypothetical protein